MPKKLFAVTNVKLGSGEGEFFAAGQEIDPSKFTKETLVQLHDAGAVEVRVVDVEDESADKPEFNTEATEPTTSPENEMAPGETPQARVEEANSSDSNVNTDMTSAASNDPSHDGDVSEDAK